MTVSERRLPKFENQNSLGLAMSFVLKIAPSTREGSSRMTVRGGALRETTQVHHFNTPSLHHSNNPAIQQSSNPAIQQSTTPSIQQHELANKLELP
jgi:hypothetical protein